jgi:hypothetical protein
MLVWKMYFLFFKTLLVNVLVLAAQTMGMLIAICLNVAELLAVVALRKPILSFMGLYSDCNVAKGGQSENFLGFCSARQNYEELRNIYGC